MSLDAYVTTEALAVALGWSVPTTRRAADRGELAPVTRTPGGKRRKGVLRWLPEDAAAIVRSRGRKPPEAWTERAA